MGESRMSDEELIEYIDRVAYGVELGQTWIHNKTQTPYVIIARGFQEDTLTPVITYTKEYQLAWTRPLAEWYDKFSPLIGKREFDKNKDVDLGKEAERFWRAAKEEEDAAREFSIEENPELYESVKPDSSMLPDIRGHYDKQKIEEDLSVARQSLYEVAEQRNDAEARVLELERERDDALRQVRNGEKDYAALRQDRDTWRKSASLAKRQRDRAIAKVGGGWHPDDDGSYEVLGFGKPETVWSDQQYQEAISVKENAVSSDCPCVVNAQKNDSGIRIHHEVFCCDDYDNSIEVSINTTNFSSKTLEVRFNGASGKPVFLDKDRGEFLRDRLTEILNECE